ncbi:MAG: NAD-dependent epimerase/dehydratase family protein [Lentisphaerae bacterium]|nr:NAD-dependent epimerase/dehydratase family protein [Lentisphaerota bacterium]
MNKVLITGITGMIGSHLAHYVQEQGCEVAGISRATTAFRMQAHRKMPWKHYAGDILDVNFLEKAVKDFQPDVVFHLAAQAYNGQSYEAEQTTYALNITGSWNVYNAVLRNAPNARVIPACSSAAYGAALTDDPVNEESPLKPLTPYGVTKAAMEMMGRQFCLNYGLDVVLPRLFIHVGPNHPPLTAVQNFARQIAAIKCGLQEPVMQVGNLTTSRDFIDVRDGASALWTLVQKGVKGEVYNICRGYAWKISDVLELLLKIADIKVTLQQDPKLMRPSDEKTLLGDNRKLRALGWEPVIPFETTLLDIYNNWIERLQA